MNKGTVTSFASGPGILAFLAISSTMLLASCANSRPPLAAGIAKSQPRVVRISFVGQHGSFQMQVNRQQIQKFGNTNFAELIIQLNLGYGDIVVWEDQRDKNGKELSHPDDISEWWSRYLEKTRVSFYSLPSDMNFFSTPFFHWLAPAVNPRSLSEANFFVDGNPLGNGSRGFHKMLDAIDDTKSGRVIIFAPRIKNEGRGPWIALSQLTAWSKSADENARFEKLDSRIAEFWDMARFTDEDY
jgi:hypothetical protein